VQEVRCEKGATIRTADNIFFCGKGNENHKLRTDIFVHYKSVSAVKESRFYL
jgi:hypothetical protein